MFTAAELRQLREMASSALPDTGTLKRAAGTAPVFDPDDGSLTPAEPITIYEGALRVRNAGTDDLEKIVGEAEVTKSRFLGILPWSAPEPKIDDLFEVATSSDPRIAGHAFRVRGVAFGSYLADRRVGLELVR